MQVYERDFLLNRIVCGYNNYKINNKKIKYLHSVSPDLTYEASELYYDTYRLAKEEELMDDKEIYDFLCNNYNWSKEDEDRLTIHIPEYIDNCKVEMFKNYESEEYCKKARKYIDRAEEELNTLFNKRHSFDHLTCHGTAIYARYQFIVENSIDNIDSLTQLEIVDIMELNNLNRISETTLREIARTEPWRGIWSIGKKTHIFSCSAFHLSDDQKRLMQWTHMYDNIYENHECPPDEVIENDDLLDGWFIVKRRESKKDKKRSELEKRIGKNANADEIFVVAKSEDDVKNIFDMNDDMSKNIVSNRIKLIQKHGEISHDKLNDVKQELEMQYNNNVRAYHAR